MSQKTIKIRINIDENDPLFGLFNEIKENTGLNFNTEVVRYSIKKAHDSEKEKPKQKEQK